MKHMQFSSSDVLSRKQQPTDKIIRPSGKFTHYCGALENYYQPCTSLQQITFLLLPFSLKNKKYKKHPLLARAKKESRPEIRNWIFQEDLDFFRRSGLDSPFKMQSNVVIYVLTYLQWYVLTHSFAKAQIYILLGD